MTLSSGAAIAVFVWYAITGPPSIPILPVERFSVGAAERLGESSGKDYRALISKTLGLIRSSRSALTLLVSAQARTTRALMWGTKGGKSEN